jgi:hypothetical protein
MLYGVGWLEPDFSRAVPDAARCFRWAKRHLRGMANESGKPFATRPVRSHREAATNGVRLERGLSAPEKESRSKFKGKSPTMELSQDSVAMKHVRRSAKQATVTFGSVTVSGGTLPIEEVKRNIASGNSALVRAASAFTRPGVRLSQGKNIPFYRADPTEPRFLIRELNGRSERVILVDGEFKLAE